MSNPISGLLSVEKPSPKRRPALPEVKCRANCEASARYRESRGEEYHEMERQHVARRCAHLKMLQDGDTELEQARSQARAAAARYRARHRERLAMRACDARKSSFILKHGFRAYLKHRLDNL